MNMKIMNMGILKSKSVFPFKNQKALKLEKVSDGNLENKKLLNKYQRALFGGKYS